MWAAVDPNHERTSRLLLRILLIGSSAASLAFVPLWVLLLDGTWPAWVLGAHALLLTGLAIGVALRHEVKPAAILGLCVFAVAAPVVLLAALRATSTPAQYAHDSVVQTEEAMRFLLEGRDPYRESYAATPLADVPFFGESNPALEHLVYYPGSFLLGLPLYAAAKALTGTYDHRLFLLLSYAAALWGAWHLAEPEWRNHLLAVVGLNPTFNYFLIQGDNDVVVLGLILGAVALARLGRLTGPAVMVGTVAAVKQSAWFFAALFLADVLGRLGGRRALSAALIVAGTGAAFVAPFVLWDAGAFLEDTYGYLAGTAGRSYPVAGMSIAHLLSMLSLAPQNGSWLFPALQLGLVLPILIACLVRQSRRPGASALMLRYGVVLTASFLCARYFSVTHLAYLSVIFVASAFASSGSSVTTESLRAGSTPDGAAA